MASLADILHDALAGSKTGCLHPKFDLAQCDSLAVVLDAAGVTVQRWTDDYVQRAAIKWEQVIEAVNEPQCGWEKEHEAAIRAIKESTDVRS